MDPSDHITESLAFASAREAHMILGHHDRHLRLVRDAFSVRLAMRGETLVIEGPEDAVRRVQGILLGLVQLIRERGFLRGYEVEQAIAAAAEGGEAEPGDGFDVIAPGVTVRAKTSGQVAYARALRECDLVFCSGPAGAGKTYLAVAAAVSALRSGAVKRIVLTRPAVEAGEKLGFLPGDFQAKVNPYLRPLYDALGDMMALEQLRRYAEMDIVEVAPLAYMRGRTLDHAVIILDEGQNCTPGQMRMFLTRLGAHSRAVVTGDLSQTDLPPGQESGMKEAMDVLSHVRSVAMITLGQADIVRHRLVQDIVDAYRLRDERRAGAAHKSAAAPVRSPGAAPASQAPSPAAIARETP